MSANNWFPRTRDGKNNWADRTRATTAATIDGTAELPPLALLAQVSWGFSAAAALSVTITLAGSASFGFSASGSLDVTAVDLTDDVFLRSEADAILYTEVGETSGNEIMIEPPVRTAAAWPDFEDIAAAASDWRLMTSTGMMVSPLNGRTQTVNRGGERWACTLSYRLSGSSAAVVTAQLAALRGPLTRLTLPDHAYQRRGALTTNLSVYGPSQVGTELHCDGGTASIANAVMAGDMFSLEGRLYMIVVDDDTNRTGNITLQFVPALDEAPADNAEVEFLDPAGEFMVADSTVAWTYAPAGLTTIQGITFVEYRA